MNDLCADIGYKSINHIGEQLCGDHVDIVEQGDNSTVIVLADGLGSGVKASILSTLTSKIISTMMAEGLTLEDCVETIAQTLPICSVRGVAYSTFTILHLVDNREMELISVKQGYVNCSVCAVDRSSIITADSGIAEKCGKSGMDVLLIEPGYFELDGYDCGFIGGCTFKLSSGVLAFTGRIDMHPDKKRIIDFLYSHAVEVLYLTTLPAFDIGGAIPISEKTS